CGVRWRPFTGRCSWRRWSLAARKVQARAWAAPNFDDP
ncbi:MAG: hypothetical protein AVDCRST_MAG02-3708, partial [uncultured Rubrobacteraceae bacterium]